MSDTVRMTLNEAVASASVDRLKRLAERPADQINTDDIPEKHFDLELAARRRREGWRPGVMRQKKAS